jgi:hypothetical protein
LTRPINLGKSHPQHLDQRVVAAYQQRFTTDAWAGATE